jgi:hypothetical protein
MALPDAYSVKTTVKLWNIYYINVVTPMSVGIGLRKNLSGHLPFQRLGRNIFMLGPKIKSLTLTIRYGILLQQWYHGSCGKNEIEEFSTTQNCLSLNS